MADFLGIATLHDKLRLVRKGGEVVRFHTEFTLQRDTVGHHSFGVAWLVWLLTDGRAGSHLIMAALAHDLPEYLTGDIPAPTKRRVGLAWDEVHKLEDDLLELHQIKFQLTDGEKLFLKLADHLDGMMFCARERALGNHSIDPIYRNFLTYATLTLEKLQSKTADSVMTAIIDLWAMSGDPS